MEIEASSEELAEEKSMADWRGKCGLDEESTEETIKDGCRGNY